MVSQPTLMTYSYLRKQKLNMKETHKVNPPHGWWHQTRHWPGLSHRVDGTS